MSSHSGAFAPRCIYVYGPPGSGKSTLVERYLSSHGVAFRHRETVHTHETDVIFEGDEGYPLIHAMSHPSVQRLWILTNVEPSNAKRRDWNLAGTIQDKIEMIKGSSPWDETQSPQDLFPVFRFKPIYN